MFDYPFTQAEIAELEKLCDAATEGPWPDGQVPLYEGSVSATKDDLAFIEASRTALPRLLAEVKKLRDEAESWAETVEEWKDLHKLSERRNCRMGEALVYIADHSLHPDLASGRASHALEDPQP